MATVVVMSDGIKQFHVLPTSRYLSLNANILSATVPINRCTNAVYREVRIQHERLFLFWIAARSIKRT
jgi:hypothetical protein